MQITVRKYSHGWLTATLWQISVYAGNDPLYFYGRSYNQARKHFNTWFAEKNSPLPKSLNQANSWNFEEVD